MPQRQTGISKKLSKEKKRSKEKETSLLQWIQSYKGCLTKKPPTQEELQNYIELCDYLDKHCMDCGQLMLQQGSFHKQFDVVHFCDNKFCVRYMKDRQGRLILYVIKPVSLAKLFDAIVCAKCQRPMQQRGSHDGLAVAYFCTQKRCPHYEKDSKGRQIHHVEHRI